MEHRPSWKADGRSESQDISIFYETRIFFRVYTTELPASTLNQVNPVHKFQPISLKSTLILAFPLCLGFPSGIFSLGFTTRIFYALVGVSEVPACI